MALLALHSSFLGACPNAAPDWNATLSTFDARVRRDYVGQAEPRRIARESLYRFFGRTRSTCGERVLHFTGPSGSGKSFLAQITAEAIFDAWEYELYPSMTYGDDCTAAHAYDVRSFRARRSFPSQCGVNQHKFSAATTERAVELWGQRVAETLLSDGSAVVIVDDVLRIDDQAALDRLGELICPSGDGIPAFKTAEGEEAKAARALFILTSDLEPPQGGERHLACDAAHTWAEVVAAVGRQQDDFWRTSGLRRPEWWSRVGLVPFRELCPAELSEATRKCAAQFFGAQFFGAQFFGAQFFGAQFCGAILLTATTSSSQVPRLERLPRVLGRREEGGGAPPRCLAGRRADQANRFGRRPHPRRRRERGRCVLVGLRREGADRLRHLVGGRREGYAGTRLGRGASHAQPQPSIAHLSLLLLQATSRRSS